MLEVYVTVKFYTDLKAWNVRIRVSGYQVAIHRGKT